MARLRRKKNNSHSPRSTLPRVLPNIATMAALCVGMSGIRFALFEQWQLAVVAITIAAILDTVDGRLARILGSVSRFGAQLDSLADFVSFGAAPAIIVYFYSMKAWGGFGWGVCLIFCVCSALRLARFNVQSSDAQPAWSLKFFTGIPVPAATLLCLAPLMIEFECNVSWARSPVLNALCLIILGLMMVSRVPTFTFKTARISHRYFIPLMIGVTACVAGLISAPWATLLIIGLGYLLSFPFSIHMHRRLSKVDERND